MKSKREIYENIVETANKQDKENYLEYYKVFRETQNRTDLTQDEIDNIRKVAYEEYKRKEAELEDILIHAEMDYLHDTNPITA